MMLRTLSVLALCGLAACGSTQKRTDGSEQVASALGQDIRGSGGERCNGGVAGREVSEYDTSGDRKPDVRKVYMSLGSGAEARLVMICRELDLNGDGRKDVIRYYDDEGRTLREESDRDFDGKVDLALVFQEGRIQRKETDDDRDGDIDSKVFYEDGKPLRIERDLSGRSTATQWNPDRWEYYEDGRIVRIGTDVDGDTRVDRWDRDAALEEEGPSPEQRAAIDTASEAATDAESEAQP